MLPRARKRKPLDWVQLCVLENSFANDPYMYTSLQRRIELANQIGWNEVGVYQWFRRALGKRKMPTKVRYV